MTIFTSRPTKRLFVETLSKDISVSDAILDLIDNAISSAVSHEVVDVLDKLLPERPDPEFVSSQVILTINADSITLFDTCGGITLDDARNRVFVFGATNADVDMPALSVYGVGMKRAFFRLGRLVEFASHSLEDPEPFELVWDISTWMADEQDWNLRSCDTGTVPHNLNGHCGTWIRISGLTPEVRAAITSHTFEADLRSKLCTSYALFILCKLSIVYGDDELQASFPDFGESDAIGIGTWHGEHADGHDVVEIAMRAGVTPKDDRQARGWYVICNGRVVLEGNKGRETGWGDAYAPAFHSKYNHFLGWVYFRSASVSALPWTTTKRGVSVESRVYQDALGQMKLLSRPVLDFLNDLYPTELSEEGLQERAALNQATGTSAFGKLQEQQAFVFKQPEVEVEPVVNVQFQVSQNRIRRAGKALGLGANAPARRVCLEAFDYFYERECAGE